MTSVLARRAASAELIFRTSRPMMSGEQQIDQRVMAVFFSSALMTVEPSPIGRLSMSPQNPPLAVAPSYENQAGESENRLEILLQLTPPPDSMSPSMRAPLETTFQVPA